MNKFVWNPQDIANLAIELSRIACEYRSVISRIYNKFGKLGLEGYWIGKNYNIIATEVMNNSRAAFIDWVDYIQYIVPQVIYSVAKLEAGGGALDFYLYQGDEEIRRIEETTETLDGKIKINISMVKDVVNEDIFFECENAKNKLVEYCRQFEELEFLYSSPEILEIYKQLESISNRNIDMLQIFQENLKWMVETSISKIEITEEETLNISKKISTIINR